MVMDIGDGEESDDGVGGVVGAGDGNGDADVDVDILESGLTSLRLCKGLGV